jgi:hypothetical protein
MRGIGDSISSELFLGGRLYEAEIAGPWEVLAELVSKLEGYELVRA